MRIEPTTATTGSTPLACRDVFELFSASFERLSDTFGDELTTYDFTFAGCPVRGRFLGAELAGIFRTAFEPDPGGREPVLEICLWDESADTGIDPRLRLACGLDEHQLRSSVVTGISESGRYVCHMAESWLNFLDLEQPAVVGCVFDRSRLGLHERARPLEWPLRFWLRSIGRRVLHAALVSRDGAGVLIGGPAGAGKSTLSLACLDAGFDFLSDDKIALEAVAPGIFVGHRLYRSILASVDMLRHFPHLAPHADRLETDALNKAILMASELFPERIAASSRIEVLLLPQLDPQLTAPRLRPARRAAAMRRILPNCLPLYPTWDGSDFGQLGDLLQAVPVHWLDIVGAPVQLPPLVGSALDASLARRSTTDQP